MTSYGSRRWHGCPCRPKCLCRERWTSFVACFHYLECFWCKTESFIPLPHWIICNSEVKNTPGVIYVVNDIKIWYRNCCTLLSLSNLEGFKSSRLICIVGRVFKHFRRLAHLSSPADPTFGHLELNCLTPYEGNVHDKVCQNGGAMRRLFWDICGKPEGA